MAEVNFRIRRGPKENLPGLEEGELGYTTDTQELYVGCAEADNLLIGHTAETPAGAQAKVDAHAAAPSAHTVTQISGAETPAGAQAKVAAHAAAHPAHDVTMIIGAETPSGSQAKVDQLKADTGIGGNAKNLTGADLNTIRSGGFYYSAGCANIPAGAANGYLIAAKSDQGNYTLQIYATYNQTGIYYRNEVNSVWTAWTPLDTAKNIPTADVGGNIWIA
ncbi:MAG: hypothetical protein P4N41_16735 [Negativicutes bacterium]|nr:hypothetical protein [Negativicutes bacterium]MDR3591302.1 hypothetical protein [Negativicutes bacterium]